MFQPETAGIGLEGTTVVRLIDRPGEATGICMETDVKLEKLDMAVVAVADTAQV